MNQEQHLLQDISAIAQRLKDIHNDAVIAYTPQVQNLCAKRATENEVEWMLDLLCSSLRRCAITDTSCNNLSS